MSKTVKWCRRTIRHVRTEEFTLRDGEVWEREIWEYADGRPSVGREEKDAIMFFNRKASTGVVRYKGKAQKQRRLPKPKPAVIVAKIRSAIKPFGGEA